MTSQRPRWGRRALIAAVVLSALWLALVVFLDLGYDRSPEVLIGGLKILAAAWLVLGVPVLVARAACRWLGRAR
jgi:hypothetical protein